MSAAVYSTPPPRESDPAALWEWEGGATLESLGPGLQGTVNQIEWAERIRVQVNGEFDRVSRVLSAAALKQEDEDQLNTQAMLVILEEKRVEVLRHNKAGYFIHDWQELRDQVRKLIMDDARYKAIKARE